MLELRKTRLWQHLGPNVPCYHAHGARLVGPSDASNQLIRCNLQEVNFVHRGPIQSERDFDHNFVEVDSTNMALARGYKRHIHLAIVSGDFGSNYQLGD